MKTIILKFSSPLQSWGIGSHFESRDTSRYPSKSAVIGLIGGALGYRRHETDKIKKLNELSFGVRIDQEGSLLKDFHIARSVNQTYVTDRYYLEDAIFLVLLSHEDDCFIEIISKALNNPVFPPYLGRRSIPVNNDFFQKVIDSEILTVIKSYKWLASDWYRKKQISQRTDNIIRLDAYLDANLSSMCSAFSPSFCWF